MEITRISTKTVSHDPNQGNGKNFSNEKQAPAPEQSVDISLIDTSVNISMNTAKIAELKEKIKSEEYPIDFAAIAEAVISLND